MKKTAQAVLKWFITQKQLDAQHIEHARRNNVTVLTLDQFKQRFFDGQSYISKRQVAAFGSARSPLDNSINVSNDLYVPLPMELIEKIEVNRNTRLDIEERRRNINIDDLIKFIRDGKIIVLMAPFGAGKSLTARELFKKIAHQYFHESHSIVPICLNLREHWGQSYFDEILERHARSIGFTPKEDLVVAWRAGLAYILLDGFDEVASQTIVRTDDRNFMKEARRVALSGVRDFLTKLPSGLGAFICGRDHYFDTEQELAHSLVISSRSYVIVRLGEFTEEGANQFLVKNGLSGTLPDWLPRKPLILAYLAQNNLLDEIIKIDSAEGYGYAWNIFIDKITQRESELEKAVIEPSTLRHVMERLAFSVRATVSGSGPITGNHLANAYSIETGQAAGEGVLAQLQRLPGLTQRDQEAGSRSFIDEDMLAALQGSAFSRIILGQYENIGDVPLSPLSHKAISVATHLLNKVDATSATPLSIAERFSLEKKAPEYKQIIADCLAVSLAMAREQGGLLDGHGILIESATFGVVDIEDTRIKNLHFSECIINQVSIGEHAIDSGLTFSNCIIKKVSGIANQKRLLAKCLSLVAKLKNLIIWIRTMLFCNWISNHKSRRSLRFYENFIDNLVREEKYPH